MQQQQRLFLTTTRRTKSSSIKYSPPSAPSAVFWDIEHLNALPLLWDFLVFSRQSARGDDNDGIPKVSSPHQRDPVFLCISLTRMACILRKKRGLSLGVTGLIYGGKSWKVSLYILAEAVRNKEEKVMFRLFACSSQVPLKSVQSGSFLAWYTWERQEDNLLAS